MENSLIVMTYIVAGASPTPTVNACPYRNLCVAPNPPAQLSNFIPHRQRHACVKGEMPLRHPCSAAAIMGPLSRHYLSPTLALPPLSWDLCCAFVFISTSSRRHNLLLPLDPNLVLTPTSSQCHHLPPKPRLVSRPPPFDHIGTIIQILIKASLDKLIYTS